MQDNLSYFNEGVPPIEQHPLQIRQRPVQQAQSQKKHCHRRVAEHVSSLTLCLSKNLIARANSSSQKRALETVVPGDGSPFKATAVSSVDGAKIQQNSETTKDLAKKSRLLSYHSAPIAGASVKAAPEDWRAVFPVVIGVCLRPSQTCKCTREYLFRTLQ